MSVLRSLDRKNLECHLAAGSGVGNGVSRLCADKRRTYGALVGDVVRCGVYLV